MKTNKNIHVLPTDKPSRIYLIKSNNKLGITSNNPEFTENFGSGTQNQNIYITSDEEIKEGDYYLCRLSMKPFKCIGDEYFNNVDEEKIILTTDQDLIKDGVQAIDDEFLELFVKNPSCERIEVNGISDVALGGFADVCYKIIIPRTNQQIINQDYAGGLEMGQIIPKEEPKYPIGGYAPGNYMCNCLTCKTKFIGDKRAVQCELCAIEMTKEEPKQKTRCYKL